MSMQRVRRALLKEKLMVLLKVMFCYQLKHQVLEQPIPVTLVGELIMRMEMVCQKYTTMNASILILQVVARLVVF